MRKGEYLLVGLFVVMILGAVGVFWYFYHPASSSIKPDDQNTESWNDVISKVSADCDPMALEKFQTQMTDEPKRLLYTLSLLENFGVINSGPPDYKIDKGVNYLGLSIPFNGGGDCNVVWLDTVKGKHVIYQARSGNIINMPIANYIIPTITPKNTQMPKSTSP